MVERFEAVRQQYKPNELRILFIGESPPAGQTFFYNGNSNLYRYTREAFESFTERHYRSYKDFLDDFRKMGCYLDDLCSVPVNELSEPERRAQRRAGITPLSRRIVAYNPCAFIVVMKDIRKEVNEAIHLAGFGPVSRIYVLDFPAMSHQHKYKSALLNALRELADADILDT